MRASCCYKAHKTRHDTTQYDTAHAQVAFEHNTQANDQHNGVDDFFPQQQHDGRKHSVGPSLAQIRSISTLSTASFITSPNNLHV
jgi:hypothetical protein